MKIVENGEKKDVEGMKTLINRESTQNDIALDIQTDGKTLWVNVEDSQLGVRCILRLSGLNRVPMVLKVEEGCVEGKVI